MVITSSAVAMSSGRAYQRQTSDRSSVSGWGEVLSAANSPTAKDSGTVTSNQYVTEAVTEREQRTSTVELFQNYSVSGKLLSEHAQSVAVLESNVRESQESAFVSDDEAPFGVEVKLQKAVSGELFGRVFSPEDGTSNRKIMSLREFFSLLIRQRQEDFKRFMDNFRIGARAAGASYSGTSSTVVTVSFGGSETTVNLGTKKLSIQSSHFENSSKEAEAEKTDFASTGKVTTADGREIDFDLNLSMSRTFARSSETSLDVVQAQLTDPLVVNFGTGSTELTDKTFSFDIDADGELDNIAVLGQACGYLAYDKNDDGVINDGSELFGAGTGNGFEELAVYDADGNGWIDENDPIFDKLKIWSKDADGNDVLVGLGVRGIGAIYLGSAPTEFSINNLSNETLGVVRSSGVFLREDGSAGSIQQVDMAKVG